MKRYDYRAYYIVNTHVKDARRVVVAADADKALALEAASVECGGHKVLAATVGAWPRKEEIHAAT